MEQNKKNRPVRINIQNKELWDKEARLIKLWKTVCNIFTVFSVLIIVTIWPAIEFLPSWIAYVYMGLYVLICFGAVFIFGKYQHHCVKYNEYKFGNKRNINK